MSNCIANVATNAFPVGNIMVNGIMGCMVADSLSASLKLMNYCVAPVSNISGTANPWV